MSPTLFGCAFCGVTVGGYNYSNMVFHTATDKARWEFEFRALCKDGDGPAFLTGVGLHDDPEGPYIAPPASASRWDDPKYDRTSMDDALGAMDQLSLNDRHGFVFHDVCWRLFEDSAPAGPIMSLQRLFDIFSSLPMVGIVLNWGHDYGGVILMHSAARYPWETPFIDDEELDQRWTYPLTTPPYQSTLVDVEKELREFPTVIKDAEARVSDSLDPFSNLSEELVLIISQLLPTNDFFNARLASRAFWGPFHSQSFWLSRFAAAGERSWIFEMRKAHRSVTAEPRLVYRCSAETRLGASLKNRRRICKLLADVQDLLDTHWTCMCTVPECMTDAPTSMEGMWHEAEANIKVRPEDAHASDIGQQLHDGCQILRKVTSAIPPAIECVTLYFSMMGDGRYVSGIALCCMTNDRRPLVVGVGYRSKRSATHRFPRDSRLTGFGLAIAAGGIRGMQIHSVGITDGVNTTSGWYGDVEDCAKSLQAMTRRGVSTLRAGFDGIKMVSVGVAEGVLPDHADARIDNSSTLRQRAVWYPDIPRSTMNLNEGICSGAPLHMDNYHPLFWTLFGGPGGARLSSLTSVHVFVMSGILGIKFGYNNGTAERGPGTSELGRHISGESEDDEYVPIQSCSIDGPGGERINAISVRIQRPKPPNPSPFGLLNSLKLFTNRGHCHVFEDDHEKKGDWQEDIRPEPGTTIIGFYSSQRTELGRTLNCLGMISEAIEETGL